MNKRGTTLLMVIFTGLLFLVVGALTAADKPSDVPDDIMIDNQGYKKNTKGPVRLSHKKHGTDYKVACTECHHEYEKDKNVWKEGLPVKKCGECHNPLKKEGKVYKLNLAYHKNCKNCHRDLMKKEMKGKKLPYKKCKDCHQKKK